MNTKQQTDSNDVRDRTALEISLTGFFRGLEELSRELGKLSVELELKDLSWRLERLTRELENRTR